MRVDIIKSDTGQITVKRGAANYKLNPSNLGIAVHGDKIRLFISVGNVVFDEPLGDVYVNDVQLTVENADEKLDGINADSGGAGGLCPHRVGDILMSITDENPADKWLGTEWERIAQGKTLIGVDEGDTDFDGSELSGGEKKHQLTITEMPSHSHGVTTSNGATVPTATIQLGYANGSFPVVATGSTGGGAAHNNLQPYLTCYIWKRTA
jgi:hypothetical protein